MTSFILINTTMYLYETSTLFYNSRDLTELPHLAGTPADYKQAKELEDFWKSVGMDETFITPYDVLLSYPNVTDDAMMNRIEVLNETDGIVYQSPLHEKILHPSENKSNVVPPFNAFSKPGDINTVKGNIRKKVY